MGTEERGLEDRGLVCWVVVVKVGGGKVVLVRGTLRVVGLFVVGSRGVGTACS